MDRDAPVDDVPSPVDSGGLLAELAGGRLGLGRIPLRFLTAGGEMLEREIGHARKANLVPCRVSLRWAVPEIVPASSPNGASRANSSQICRSRK
jgi:hypothetical protein